MHIDSIDLLVTAALTLGSNAQLRDDPRATAATADTLGGILVTAMTGSNIPAYRWRPVVEILAPVDGDDEVLLQLEHTRLAFMDECSRRSGWTDSPARSFIAELGTDIRMRLGRGVDPDHLILTSQELEQTQQDWQRPTLYANLDPQENDNGST